MYRISACAPSRLNCQLWGLQHNFSKLYSIWRDSEQKPMSFPTCSSTLLFSKAAELTHPLAYLVVVSLGVQSPGLALQGLQPLCLLREDLPFSNSCSNLSTALASFFFWAFSSRRFWNLGKKSTWFLGPFQGQQRSVCPPGFQNVGLGYKLTLCIQQALHGSSVSLSPRGREKPRHLGYQKDGKDVAKRLVVSVTTLQGPWAIYLG